MFSGAGVLLERREFGVPGQDKCFLTEWGEAALLMELSWLWWPKTLAVGRKQMLGMLWGRKACHHGRQRVAWGGGDRERSDAPNHVPGSSILGSLGCETSLVSHSKG